MESFLTYLIPVFCGVSVFFFAVSLLPSKSVLAEQIEELKAHVPLQRDLSSPLAERIFKGERRIILVRQLAEAGWYTTTPAQFALRVVGGAALGPIVALLVWKLANLAPEWLVPLLAIFTFCGAYSPFYLLNRAIEQRHTAIQKSLPEFLDMVASTVQAGLALNSALAYSVEAARGPLGEEIKEALSEIRLGRSRADALKGAGDRTNQPALRNALRVMTQAERLGANIAKMLTELAEDARHQRLMLVEEMAGKLPVKMVFPMVFFMIPSIFTIIFGTVAVNYFTQHP
ncbi:MAG TPA: type II secretion system F family protein [Candidatus Binatia bacterium]|nr:type II secretion system F family protein [Candidatus Binatia bacterium]